MSPCEMVVLISMMTLSIWGIVVWHKVTKVADTEKKKERPGVDDWVESDQD